ncbi:hypothetical protein [Mycoplasmopsis lipofaciens]|uniref:hypothetical protein n=1 Tax=Mycoplasmopsis lipofaciens TaxID=114884 RepID=UPI0012EBA83F|nr:hypothetical protein [Mycoplasmopsis lipofaciens]
MKKNRFKKIFIGISFTNTPIIMISMTGCAKPRRIKNENNNIQILQELNKFKYLQNFKFDINKNDLDNEIKQINDEITNGNLKFNNIKNKIPTDNRLINFTFDYLWARNLIKFYFNDSYYNNKYLFEIIDKKYIGFRIVKVLVRIKYIKNQNLYKDFNILVEGTRSYSKPLEYSYKKESSNKINQLYKYNLDINQQFEEADPLTMHIC